MYFILDNKYDLSGLYRHPFIKQIACNGYLSFTLNGGYSNIRITDKIIKLTTKNINIKEILNLRRIK
jgi:hypothetical protein